MVELARRVLGLMVQRDLVVITRICDGDNKPELLSQLFSIEECVKHYEKECAPYEI